MLMTKRLYYDNSYLTEFEATVVEQYRKRDAFAIILDRTAFYPISGGQMADKGFLNDQIVQDVIEEGDEVAHLVAEPIHEEVINGKLDWQRRFDFMQQHTGFHILAQSFLQIMRVETLSSHLGENVDTIDIDLTKLTREEVNKVEELANEVVFQNRFVESIWVKKNELENLSLRKIPQFLDKPIRLVDIKDFDLDPCGGTHVRTTGEVGMIKILSWEKVRNNIRCTFVVGKRALYDYQKRTVIVQRINQILSTMDDESIQQVELLKQNLKNRDKQLKMFKQQLLQFKVDQLVDENVNKKQKVLIKEFKDKETEEIRFLAVQISKKIPTVAAFYSSENPAYFVMSCDGSLQLDFTPLIPNLREILQAKGGGNAIFVELNQLDKNQLPKALELMNDFLTKNK